MIQAIADSSAWIKTWRAGSDLADASDRAHGEGRLALCEPVRLEILRGARSGAEALDLDAALDRMVMLSTDAEAWRLARRTLVQLAHLPGGRHRGPSLTDVLVAATAERHGVAVLHGDADFELIAQVTGQPVLRIGS